MTDTLEGKAAIVTGSARNIGRAIALALSDRGASVVIHGQSDRDAAETVQREIADKGGKAIVHLAELTDEQACQGLVDAAIAAFGRLDILVCNAAVRRQKPFLETTFAEWREMLSVDLDSVFLVTRAGAPHIVSAGGGSIVCLGGSPSHLGTRGRSHVCAAKMGPAGRNCRHGLPSVSAGGPLRDRADHPRQWRHVVCGCLITWHIARSVISE